MLCVKDDVYAQLQNGSERLNSNIEECNKLREIIEVDTKVAESREEKIYELEKYLTYMKNTLNQKDEIISNLKVSMLETKK